MVNNFPTLRKIIFGGEGFPKPKLKQLFDMFGHRAELENVYGPTECTCICSAHTIHVADFEDMQNLIRVEVLSANHLRRDLGRCRSMEPHTRAHVQRAGRQHPQ